MRQPFHPQGIRGIHLFILLLCTISFSASCTGNVKELQTMDENIRSFPFDFYSCEAGIVAACLESMDSSAEITGAEQTLPEGGKIIAGTVSHHALASEYINAYFSDLSAARSIDTFIIISPRHFPQGDSYISISPLPWDTGSGTVEVDTELYNRFSEELNLASDPWAFVGEHGIETLLPYIQRYFPEAGILPILQKETPLRLDIIARLAAVTRQVIEQNENTFLLLSSDFSHHEGPVVTQQRDRKSRIFLEEINAASLQLVGCDNIGGMSVLKEVLGAFPTVTTSIRNHSDSLEISGEQELDITSYFFSYFGLPDPEQNRKMLETARSSVRRHFRHPAISEFTEYPYSDNPGGVAVRFRSGAAERGCISYYEGVSDLPSAVASAAVNAAFFDGRYPPVEEHELKDIQIEISVIGPGVVLENPLDFISGAHSLRISGPGGHAFMQASLSVENQWSREYFLRALCRKAGLPRDTWQDNDYQLVRYPTYSFSDS